MRPYVLFDAFDPLTGWTGDAPLPKLPGQVAAQADLASLAQQEEALLAQQSEVAMQQSLMEMSDLAAIAHELTAQVAATDAESGGTAWNPFHYGYQDASGGHYHSEWGGSSFDCYVSPSGDVFINDYDAYAGTHTFAALY